METLAPVLESSRPILLEMMGSTHATDRELQDFTANLPIECREIPRKAAALVEFASTAWEAVASLADSGIQFAGTVSDAAAVVAATTYAAWRASAAGLEDDGSPAGTQAVTAFWAGIQHAKHHRCGMPAMYRWEYLQAVAGSDDPVDARPLWETLVELWPQRFGGRKITTCQADGVPPQYAADDQADPFLANAPSIFDDVATRAAR